MKINTVNPKFSHLRSFIKLKPSCNAEIILSSTDISNACPSREFLTGQLCLLKKHGGRKNLTKRYTSSTYRYVKKGVSNILLV